MSRNLTNKSLSFNNVYYGLAKNRHLLKWVVELQYPIYITYHSGILDINKVISILKTNKYDIECFSLSTKINRTKIVNDSINFLLSGHIYGMIWKDQTHLFKAFGLIGLDNFWKSSFLVASYSNIFINTQKYSLDKVNLLRSQFVSYTRYMWKIYFQVYIIWYHILSIYANLWMQINNIINAICFNIKKTKI